MSERNRWCAVLVAVLVVACEDPYQAGLQAFEDSDWATAIDRLERVAPFHLNYRDAQQLIRESQFAGGVEAIDKGQWELAVRYLRQIDERDPNHAAARDHVGAAFYEMARRAFAGGDSKEALRLSHIVHSTCSRFDEARDLARQARRRLDEEEALTAPG